MAYYFIVKHKILCLMMGDSSINMDSKLLYRLKEGDRDAFNTVYWRYSPKVYNTVLYLLNDSDAAEDIVQELFLTIWERRGQIQPELNFEAYIATIARNLAYNYVRKAFHNNQSVEDINDSNLITNSDEGTIEAESLREYIFNVISSFPEMRRKVFIMSRFENLSHAEIAEKLTISERTVDVHIYHALKELRKVLGDKAVAFLFIYLSM